MPLPRGVCRYDCVVRPGKDDTCRGGGGTCLDGGAYCGGDKLDGDPRTLYRCMAGVGTVLQRCVTACVVRSADDDACQ